MNSVLCVSRVLSRVFWNGIANLSANTTSANSSNANSNLESTNSNSPRIQRPLAAAASRNASNTASVSKATIANSSVNPRLISAVCGFPKNRAYKNIINGKFGDDAWFRCSSSKADVLGVADGVGGWRSYGIDPGEFPMHLMQTCERYVNIEKFTPENPLELLKQSYEEIMHHRKSILGSSTACVVILNKDKCTVYTSNIGDSGFIIIRKGEVILRSREQQHYFNTPFQLSIPPPSYRNNVLIDQPDVAQNAHVRVENGDVILLASDGVFDNLPDDLIITEMSKVEGSSNAVQIQTTANSIAWMSRCLSYDQSFLSPFSKNAFSNGILRPGGKPDDITVLLATVVV